MCSSHYFIAVLSSNGKASCFRYIYKVQNGSFYLVNSMSSRFRVRRDLFVTVDVMCVLCLRSLPLISCFLGVNGSRHSFIAGLWYITGKVGILYVD